MQSTVLSLRTRILHERLHRVAFVNRRFDELNITMIFFVSMFWDHADAVSCSSFETHQSGCHYSMVLQHVKIIASRQLLNMAEKLNSVASSRQLPQCVVIFTDVAEEVLRYQQQIYCLVCCLPF